MPPLTRDSHLVRRRSRLKVCKVTVFVHGNSSKWTFISVAPHYHPVTSPFRPFFFRFHLNISRRKHLIHEKRRAPDTRSPIGKHPQTHRVLNPEFRGLTNPQATRNVTADSRTPRQQRSPNPGLPTERPHLASTPALKPFSARALVFVASSEGNHLQPATLRQPTPAMSARRTTPDSTSTRLFPTPFQCAIIRPLHRGRTHLDELCQKPIVPAVSPRVAAPLTSRLWQSLGQTLPTIDHQPSPSNLPTTPSSITGCPGARHTRHLPGRPFRPASSCRPRPNNPRPDPGQQEL